MNNDRPGKPNWRGKPKRGGKPPRALGDRPPPVIEVDAERLAPEGSAICRDKPGGRVVFVPYAVPGDRLAVEILEGQDTFAKARLRRLIAAGSERREPPCPLHFAPGRRGAPCGGCDWQMISYAGQLRHKRQIVADCLARIAKLPEVPVLETIASPQEWGYRNKVQVPFGFDSHARKLVAGFYAPGSHEIVNLEACPVQPELSVKIALKVKEYAKHNRWPAYEQRTGRGWLRHLFVRTNAEGKALAALVTTTPQLPGRAAFVAAMRQAFPELISLYQNVQHRDTSVVLGTKWIKLWGEQGLKERIGEFTFFASPGAFLQVNTPAAEILYRTAVEFMREGNNDYELVLDLYCGVGTLSVWLAKTFRRVIGIEESYAAVHDARANAARNGVMNCRFVCGKAEKALESLRGDLIPPTAALVDPPRMGLAEPVLCFLGSSMIKRIVYVSCNPATFARDAARLVRTGYSLRRVQPLDLFPQTSHVELVALLDRP